MFFTESVPERSRATLRGVVEGHFQANPPFDYAEERSAQGLIEEKSLS
jgi:hypothetical protein